MLWKTHAKHVQVFKVQHQDFGKLYLDKVTREAEVKKKKKLEVRQLHYEYYKEEIQTIPQPRLLQINNNADLDI